MYRSHPELCEQCEFETRLEGSGHRVGGAHFWLPHRSEEDPASPFPGCLEGNASSGILSRCRFVITSPQKMLRHVKGLFSCAFGLVGLHSCWKLTNRFPVPLLLAARCGVSAPAGAYTCTYKSAVTPWLTSQASTLLQLLVGCQGQPSSGVREQVTGYFQKGSDSFGASKLFSFNF